MIELTPAERRAVLLLTLLLLLGAITDGLSDRWPGAPGGRAGHPDSLSGMGGDGGAGAGGGLPATGVAADATASPNGSAATGAGPGSADSAARIDINRATARELDALPGVGPVLAARILEHRARYGAFREPSDLRAVRGIGPKLFARIEGRIRIGPEQAP